jgi:hypothetical protein
VQISVKHVLRNVNDILIWTIVKGVHKYVEDVLKNVVKFESEGIVLPGKRIGHLIVIAIFRHKVWKYDNKNFKSNGWY